ncbi:MAG: hypothetical protein KAG66_16140, partial [Methylococcales bacterium]|nr:hypothetical protein [Methylococcales bacterium]
SPPDSALFLRMPKLPSFPDSKGEAVVFYIDQTTFLPVILDRFAYNANDHFPSLADKNGVSLERLSLKRSAQDPSNWHSAASTVKFATPGYANSQRVELSGGEDKLTLQNPSFSPDGDAHDDVLIINYDFSGIGGNALVSIYDTHGRKIKNLRQNMLLGPGEGTVFWDGTDELGHTADMGMYVVLFEVSLSSGKREVHRAVCVLAKRL